MTTEKEKIKEAIDKGHKIIEITPELEMLIDSEKNKSYEAGKAETIKQIDNLTEDDWENLIQLDSLDEIKAELKSKIGELAILRRTRKMKTEKEKNWDNLENDAEVTLVYRDLKEILKNREKAGKSEAIKQVKEKVEINEEFWTCKDVIEYLEQKLAENKMQKCDGCKIESKILFGDFGEQLCKKCYNDVTQVTELKTLKDLKRINVWEGFEGHIEVNELKAEAVKWIKANLKAIDKPKPMTDIVAWNYSIAFINNWIKHFFNITEEELAK